MLDMREYAQRVMDLTAGHTKEDSTEERDWPLRLSLERAIEIIGEAGGGATAAGTGKGRLGSPWPVSGWLGGGRRGGSPQPGRECRSSAMKRDLAKQSETRRYTGERIAGGRAARMARVQTNLKGEIV
jgi:hypothetical protein